MKITLDLNVLLDVAQNRLPHFHASEEVLHRARAGEYAAVLPGHAITTLHYVIEKWSGIDLANQTIDGLLADFDIHPPDKTNFKRARQLHCEILKTPSLPVSRKQLAANTSLPATCRILRDHPSRRLLRRSFSKPSPELRLNKPAASRTFCAPP